MPLARVVPARQPRNRQELEQVLWNARLRLGVMVSADEGFIRLVGDAIPIWNVNSLAERFLQIAPEFDADYRQSCAKVALERVRLEAGLAASGVLRPVPSCANFVTCEVAGGLSARD